MSDLTPDDKAALADRIRADRRLRETTESHEAIFATHRCWRCNHGEKACVQGDPARCDYPRALND